MKRFALAGLAILAAGCGGEKESTETESVFVPPPPPSAESFVPADTLGFFPDEDSLAADSLALADSARAPAPPPPAPSFAPFLEQFKQALQTGDARRYAAPDLTLDDLALVTDDADFRQRVLAVPPDRFRREGTRREVYVVVGYDMDGNVVPEDEAETESGLGLVFDVVNGAYRLVRVEVAG